MVIEEIFMQIIQLQAAFPPSSLHHNQVVSDVLASNQSTLS
jgi:hypothetical protein